MTNLRIGHGFDIHPFADGRRLVLGGVEIPHGKGLAGHSDADALLHAVCDAILGAMGLPDIGQHFPPSDQRFKDADSRRLLRQVVDMARRHGLQAIVNVDVAVLAEVPKLSPHIPAMRKIIAEILEVDESRIGIKATTCERLGAIGREEGIAASAVCLLERHD
jgi:2-C-methyl-D-erythritol 2,4-cyclodiphosphate synthase